MRILCIDDDPIWLGLIKEMLKEAGGQSIRVVTSLTGTQAIRALEHSSYDLVISDLRLCDMSGFDLIHTIHRRWPELRLVALTGHNDLSTVSEARACGADYCLFKPLSMGVLTDMLKVLGMLDSDSAPSQPQAAFAE